MDTTLYVENQPGGMFAVIDKKQCPGSIFYVNSATGLDAVGHGKNPDAPFATIAYAFSSDVLTADAGDWVIVAPGHTETIGAAGGITCDIANVRVIGQPGRGSKRPTITFDTTVDSTIVMSAASVTWENFIFLNTQDLLTVAFPVTAAHCGFENCEFNDDGTDNTAHWFTLSAAADDFRLFNCINKGTDTAGNTAFITIAATSHVQIVGLISNGDFGAANIDFSAAGIDVLIADCFLENANGIDVNIEGFAGLTGWIARNCCRLATDVQVTWINTPGAASLFENYGVNDDAETGMIIGTVSS